MSPKQDLLNEAARAFKGLHEAIQGLNQEHMTEVWLGSWSVRDIVAHFSGWHREMGPALERMARGEPPIPEGRNYLAELDVWNEKYAAAKRSTPVAEVLLELDQSHEYFLHAAAQVPDDRFVEGTTAWKIVDLSSAHHYKQHAEQIRAWRATRGI